jgi:hypothetical protein
MAGWRPWWSHHSPSSPSSRVDDIPPGHAQTRQPRRSRLHPDDDFLIM